VSRRPRTELGALLIILELGVAAFADEATELAKKKA
jgi:hypothetical protein